MTTQRSSQRLHSTMATRKAGSRLGRLATVLAAVISGLLASVAAATTAFAQSTIPVGNDTTASTPVPSTVVRVISTGLAGWQIALIVVAAALAAAVAAVFADRKLAGRRGLTAA